MTIGVIISTYNNPAWLAKTLFGYTRQTVRPDEVVIADDGSTDDTRALIDSYRDRLPIKHVWHEDRGFQKSEILNKAIKAATADYLIFTDQDCVPRADFVATHKALAREGRYLSGGYFKLTRPVSESLTDEDIASGRAFSANWLRQNGQPFSFKMRKLVCGKIWAAVMNHITPRAATFNGCNSSCWRKDAVAVNGFNELMHYGGQDREFGLRLKNSGVKPTQTAYSAIVVHLDHSRPYKTKETMEANRRIMEETIKTCRKWTEMGIKHPEEQKEQNK
ncbi:MAG: glycosyltransferase family 2 protein [Marinilabiliaceae bacterium]